MAIQSMDELSALSPGCKVWIIAEPSRSAWARKIDWYLNYQVMKAELHARQSLSNELREIMDQAELSVPLGELSDRAPLMIACQNLLPATSVVCVQFLGNREQWARNCAEIWRELRLSTVRVFLPDELRSEELSKIWHSAQEKILVELVEPLVSEIN